MNQDVEALISENKELKKKIAELEALHLSKSESQVHKEEALFQPSKYYTALYHALSEGIVVRDKEGVIIDCNKFASFVFGIDHLQVLGKKDLNSPWELTQEDGSIFEHQEYPAIKCLKTQKPIRGIVMGVKSPDGIRWINMNAEPIRSEQGIDWVIMSFIDITHLKTIQKEIKHEKLKSEKYLFNLGAFIVVLDQKLFVHTINRRACELLEICDIDALGKYWLDEFVAIEAIETVTQELNQIFNEDLKRPKYTEYHIVTQRGARKLIAWHITTLLNESGEIEQLVCTGEDITEKRELEIKLQEYQYSLEQTVKLRTKELAEKQQLLQTVTSEAAVVLFSFDENGIFTFSDGKGLDKLGLKPGQVVGLSVFEVYKDYPGITEQSKKALKGEEVRGTAVIGNIYFDISYQPLIDNNKLMGVVGVAIDITSLKETEIALRSSTQQMQKVQEFAHLGSWEYNIQNREVNWSDEFFRICGYTPRSFKPTVDNWIKVIYEEDANMVIQATSDAIKHNSRIQQEHRVKHPDGEIRYVRSIADVIRDEHDRPIRLLGSYLDITELKQQQIQLQKSEQLFHDVFNTVADSIFIFNKEQEIIEVNSAAEKQYGYSKDEFKRLKAKAFISPDNHTVFDRFIQDLHQKGTFNGETLDVRKNGSTFNTMVSGAYMMLEGEPHLLGVVRDVTQQKKWEYQVKETQAFNDLIFENSPLGILSYNSNGQCVFINKRCSEILNIAHAKLLKTNLFDTNHWSKFEIAAIAKETLANGTALSKRLAVGKKKTNWIECHFSRFQSKSEYHILLMFSDVSLVVQAEKDRDRYFDTANALLCTASVDGYFLSLNASWEMKLGFTRNELLAKSFLELIHPEDLQATIDELSMLNEGKESFSFLNRYRCKDNTYRWFSWVSKIYDNKVYASAQDITEIKQQEIRITETLKDLERSNKELEQFAYVASHDLQEPLRKIKSYTELLVSKYKDKIGSEADLYVATITKGVSHMQHLIEDLLSYSRVSTRAEAFNKVNVNEVVEAVMDTLELQIYRAKAEIIVEDLPTLIGDKNQLFLIFQNLLSNAIKFRSELTPVIKIRCKETKSKYTFMVIDNGIGINEKYKEKIFTIFQRLHSKDAYEGTGIGLAIVSKIAHRHEGEVWVESEHGKGSIFYFTISKKIFVN